jgi:hypothetical protein
LTGVGGVDNQLYYLSELQKILRDFIQNHPAIYESFLVRTVGRSPTSPVIGYGNAKALDAANAYANGTLDMRNIPAYSIKADVINSILLIMKDASNKDKTSNMPFFIIHFFDSNARTVAYSFNRDTLSKIIPVASPDVKGFLQLMYDASKPPVKAQ